MSINQVHASVPISSKTRGGEERLQWGAGPLSPRGPYRTSALTSHLSLAQWVGLSAAQLTADSRGRRSPQAGFGSSCWQGVSRWHQHQRNAPQCSRAVLETLQHASCKSSAPARPPVAASPITSGSSLGPACQSCSSVLRLLQRLQVDSLMLQEWFGLQPLSWPGIPQQGGG